ncbi:uncharacterized protein F54H12.2-like [Saccostrea echinata]|uniref:uncharacterized protein F54H12.2-like n=1 Tax=Saccostrea echinata TaxID=191078 RepID=UPI002A83FDB0|nr:uncharacterized protein F54H12.2-like [Saccostrea echinata]
MLDGKFNPRNYKGRQSGSGIAGMYSKKPYMIPVNPHITVEEPKEIVGKQVTPIAAAEERAKGELKEEMRENIPHVPVGSIKVENNPKSPTSIKRRKKKSGERASDIAVEKIYYAEYRPVSAYNTEDAPIEISIPGQGNEYIDLRRSRLYVKCKIVKADGTALAAQEKTGIINLPLQSLWSQIDTYMNGKLVSLNTSYYPWKAYLKIILSSGNDASDSQLQSQLFFLDDATMDDGNAYGGTNGGLAKRYTFTKESKVFDLEGPLYEDIFRLDKYILNGVDVNLKLFRSRAPLLVMSAESTPAYKVQLLDVSFKACMIKVDSGVLINHAEILKETTAKYPLIRTEVKMNTCSKGSGSFIWQNVWSNNLPTKAYFAFISQTAVNGSYTKNIYNFQNLADEIALYVNGESMPARPMKIDVGANGNHVTAFVNLFEVAEKWNKDSGLSITRSMFSEGFAVYAFSLAPSDLGEDYINLVRQGSVRLEVKFAVNTTETLNCLAYAEFPALLEIDQSRDIKYTRV